MCMHLGTGYDLIGSEGYGSMQRQGAAEVHVSSMPIGLTRHRARTACRRVGAPVRFAAPNMSCKFTMSSMIVVATELHQQRSDRETPVPFRVPRQGRARQGQMHSGNQSKPLASTFVPLNYSRDEPDHCHGEEEERSAACSAHLLGELPVGKPPNAPRFGW